MGYLILTKVAAFAVISLTFALTSDMHPRFVGYWDIDRIFKEQLQLSLPGIPWPMIDVLVQLKFAIQSRMLFLDFCEANYDKLQHIMDISFRDRHNPRETNTAPTCLDLSLSYTLYCSFFLIMFSLTLNQCMLCTEIVVSQDPSHFGAGSSFGSASVNISICSWSV
jgi:hypothetical protein